MHHDALDAGLQHLQPVLGVLGSQGFSPRRSNDGQFQLRSWGRSLSSVTMMPMPMMPMTTEDRVVVKVHRHNPVHHEDGE